MKVFISLPMHGRTDEEIKEEMKRGVEYLKNFYKNEEVELIDTFIDLGDAPRLAYLGRSIQLMADADLVLLDGEFDVVKTFIKGNICKVS